MRLAELTTLTSFSSASNGGANHYRPRRGGKPSCLHSPSDALGLGRLAELVKPSVHEQPQPRFQNPSVDCGQHRLIADDRLRHDGGVLTHTEQR
jgi:hypothetical protein